MVRLERTENGYGLRLITEDGAPAVVVGIVPNSAASACPEIEVGDVIVAVRFCYYF